MSAADVIRRRAVALTVTRIDSETVDAGGNVAQVPAAVAGVTGHMQPLEDKELRNLPEGQLHLDWWNIWALAEIKNGDTVTDGTAPTVRVQGVKYWKEGPFWHGRGAAVTDTLGYPDTEE